MRDLPSQLSIGLFSGTFVYALLALRAVDSPPGPDAGAVPGLTILVAYALMLASLGTLVLYVAHAGRSLRPSGLIDLVGDDLHAQLARIYSTQDAGLPAATPGGSTIVATEPGVIIGLDEAGLVDLARSAGCVLRTVPMMGDFVPAQGALLEVEGDRERLDVQRARAMVELGAERTHHDDSAYGFRALVDIAERALAQPFEDPRPRCRPSTASMTRCVSSRPSPSRPASIGTARERSGS